METTDRIAGVKLLSSTVMVEKNIDATAQAIAIKHIESDMVT